MTTTATLSERWVERGFLPVVDGLALEEATRCSWSTGDLPSGRVAA